MKVDKPRFDLLPTIGSRVTVETEEGFVQGVVTGHDTKEEKLIFKYDLVAFDGALIEPGRWAWLDQLLDMGF